MWSCSTTCWSTRRRSWNRSSRTRSGTGAGAICAARSPLVAALALVVFGGLRLLTEWEWLFDTAGVPASAGIPRIGEPTALPILLLAVQLGMLLAGVVTSWVSRAFERQADLDALDLLRQPGAMADMHRRLHVKNVSDLDPGPIKRLMGSHPAPAERLAFTADWAAAHGDHLTSASI